LKLRALLLALNCGIRKLSVGIELLLERSRLFRVVHVLECRLAQFEIAYVWRQ
jgi:hypothetical protein